MKLAISQVIIYYLVSHSRMVHFMFGSIHDHRYHTHQHLREVPKNRRGNRKRVSVCIVSHTVCFDLRHQIIRYNQSDDTVSMVYLT